MKDTIHYILIHLMSLGYWGIMLGLAVEVIPSEIVLAYAGYMVQQNKINAAEAVIFGTVGIMIAQIILYAIGRYGGRPFLDKYGKYLLLKSKHIDKAEAWFNKYGGGIVFTGRFIPVLRQAISIPAGMARMSLLRFCVLTIVATVPWCILFILIGKSLGESWEQVDEKAGGYINGALWVGLGLTALFVAYKIMSSRRQKSAKYGDAGEKSTAHQLRFVGSGYHVLNSRFVKARAGSQEIDHLVVGPNGLFHIETKYWSGEIRFTGQGVERSKDGHHEDPTAQLYRHEYVLKELLREHKLQADVVGILCFSHPEASVSGSSPAFRTVRTDRLVHTINEYRPKKKLTQQEVKAIVKLLQENSSPSA